MITGVEPGTRLWNEEAPGPLLVVHRADSEDEAIRLGERVPARARGVGLDGRPPEGRADRG